MKDSLRNGEAIAGAALVALGVYIVLQARAWDYMTPDGPGPGFFPTWYGVAMIALSLALIVTSLRKTNTPQAIDWRAVGRALGTWLAFAGSVALMNVLGFVISFALLTFVVVVMIFRRSPLAAAVTGVAASLAFYLTFPVILGVQLPTGYFGF
jgi:putative tricarboxylic transport membrane protein